MSDRYFDDPDHRGSEAHAFAAERAERAGAIDAARASFAEAAKLEERAAGKVPEAEPRLRSLFAISAVSLWLKAAEWDHAARVGRWFLAFPGALTPDGQRELESLVDRATPRAQLFTP
jgi:hypothetical protein